jgi:MoaA/NifB/PqqE/SkfB family radical SAM enzyme
MNGEYHINKRNERYYVNSLKDSFLYKLQGLTTIELSVTELCTRKCSFCPRGDSTVYPNQKLFMSSETITNIANKCLAEGFEGDFHISGFGESFTHPKFLELTSTLRDTLPNNHLVLTTNGDFLNDKTINEIIKRNFNKVIVSCYDGAERKKHFTLLFEKNGFHNYDIRELWFNPEETTEDLMNRNNFNNRSGSVNVDSQKENLNINSPCYLPFYKVIIDWNGNALLCCNDWKKAHKGLGNINTHSLSDIWYGEELVKVRAQLANGKRVGPACANCNIKGTLIGKESVNLLSDKEL